MDEAGRIPVNNMKFMTAFEFIFAALPLVAVELENTAQDKRDDGYAGRAASCPPELHGPGKKHDSAANMHLRRRRAPACGIRPGEPHPHDMHLHQLLDTSVRGAAGPAVSLVVQHRVPPDSMVPAESMLVQIDVHLAAAEKSCTNMHTICHNDALPHAVFAPGNPIPAVCTFIGCWMPRCVALWQELTRFHDVLDALDGVLFALGMVRRFVREAIDAPGRFCEKQAPLQNFMRDLILDVNKSGFWLNRRTYRLYAPRCALVPIISLSVLGLSDCGHRR
jgi:hypothetical protein